MGTKNFSVVVAIFLISFISGCDPAYQFCDDMATSARVPDIFTLGPLQETYNRGDVVILRGSIANISPYFAEPNVNLLEVTGVDTAWLSVGATELFDGNTVHYINGSKRDGAANWYNMPYSQTGDVYEFEVKITLDRIGVYRFYASYAIQIIGQECNKYVIDTNIAGANVEGMIEFEVIE